MSVAGQSRQFVCLPVTSGLPRSTDIVGPARLVRFVPIVLQKSKVASARIFGETLKRKAIDDSDNLSRVTEVAYEFSVRR
jgi:hypothetical protein